MRLPSFLSVSRWRAAPRRDAVIAVVVVVAVIAALVLPTFAITRAVNAKVDELTSDFQDLQLPGESVMLAADGTEIARFATYDRKPVALADVSPWVPAALVATEDVRFYQHQGFDFIGLLRAVRNNAESESQQGGSTITMQYIKNVTMLKAELAGDAAGVRKATESTIARKASEIVKAIALERRLSKAQILEGYLNVVSFGSDAYGIEAAARRYFSTDARNLSLSQAATLVGILKAPSLLNPIRNPEGARDRRNLVLDRMLANGDISESQAQQAKAEPLGVRATYPGRGCEAATGGWGTYCDAVLRELTDDRMLGATQEQEDAAWTRGGLVIRTALVPTVQRAARAAARANVPAVHRASAVVAVVKPGTGHVAALALSKDFGSGRGKTELPLGTAPVTGPGSTMKLFTLARAVSDGIPLTTVMRGGTTYTSPTLANPASGAFHNYNTSPASNVSIVQATTRSLNTAFVQLEERVGVLRIADLATRMGATAIPLTGARAVNADEGSFTLGAREIPVVQMATAYATVAANGLACPATFITSVTTPAGTTDIPSVCQQVLTPAAARAITWTLEQVTGEGTGKSARLPDRPVAGKTGTSQDVASAWFAGFTPDWATVVMVADPRGPKYPLVNTLGHSRVYGGTIPAATFVDTMTEIHKGLPVKPMVDALDAEYLLAEQSSLTRVVPDVTGMTIADAAAALVDAGLLPESTNKAGTAVVTRTEPGPGVEVGKGAAVRLFTQ
ncbi:MAG: transglycosylase domain-containing protein [Candidatus Nanopelagicales bacterium]|nr:transglycosylase domain-containing protein [Candidatus Nanopelagicales bacterium]